MTDFVKALKRLYQREALPDETLKRLLDNGRIQKDEYDYILSEGGE